MAPPTRPSEPPPADPTRDLGGALHEVSNALTVVIGWIDRARHGAAPADLTRALDVAGSRAAHARSIVRRAIGANEQPEPSAHVAEIVDEALTGLEPELARAAVRAVQKLRDGIDGRSVDQSVTVVQILTNLLLNAIAMSPARSRVTVEAAPGSSGRDGGSVVFAVTDEGAGVPPERRATLLRAGVSTRAGGAGVGLRHAAALARANGGSLALAPSARGARFELTWPLRTTPTTPIPPPPDTPSAIMRAMPLAGTRILLVEDDDAVVDLLDTALTARGADVVSVRHRRELAAALASGPFDTALFDISPIQEDVRGAVALVRGDGAEPTLRVVLISGSAAQMPDMPAHWVSAWVRKPFEISEILQAIAPSPFPRGSTMGPAEG